MANVTVDLTIDAITDYQDGKRIWGHESYEVQGEERNRYFVVWDNKEAEEYDEGDRVRVSGLLSARTSEPNDEGRVFVQLSINNPTIKVPTQTTRQGVAKGGARKSAPARRSTRKGSDDPPF